MLLIMFLILLASLFTPKNKSGRKLFLLISVSLLIFVRVMVDWPTWDDLWSYEMVQQYCNSHGFDVLQREGWQIDNENSEPGWIAWTWFWTRIISSNFYLFLFINATLCLTAYYSIIKKYVSPNYYLVAILIVFLSPYVQSIYVLRQHVSIALIFLSYPYILKRNWKVSLFLVLFAFALHTTAFIALPLFSFYYIKDNKKLIFALIAYAVVAISSIQVLAVYFTEYMEIGAMYLEKTGEDASNAKNALLYSGLLLMRLYFLKGRFFEDGATRLLSIVAFFASINAIAGTGVGGFMDRLNLVYMVAWCVVFPNTMTYVRNRKTATIISVGFVLFLFFFFYKNALLADSVLHYRKFLWD